MTSPSPREARVRQAQQTYSASLSSTLIKIVLLGIFDALMIFAAMTAAGQQSWLILAGIVASRST